MANLNDLLTSAQQAVQAIRSLTTTLSNTFLQQGTVVASTSGVITALSTITFQSSVAAGFIAVTTSSGVAYYLPVYR